MRIFRERSLLWLMLSFGLLVSCLVAGAMLAQAGSARNEREPATSKVHGQVDPAASVADFEAMVPVLRNPRCMNCHARGDFPRQGDDSHPHIMGVRRGPDGHGVNAVKCSTCHQDHNLPGLHRPPGAPDWALPSPAMPMIWEGLSDRQLCLLLEDPRQNGHRNMQQIVEHMHTPLVLWGWHPGEGRTPIPMPQDEFLARVTAWVAAGGACPTESGSRLRAVAQLAPRP